MAFLHAGGLPQIFRGPIKGFVGGVSIGLLVFALQLSTAQAEDLGFFTPTPPTGAVESGNTETADSGANEDTEATEPSWTTPSGDATAFPHPANAQAELAPYLDLIERLVAIKTDLSNGQVPDPALVRKYYGDFLRAESGFTGAILTPTSRERAALILEIIDSELETGFANVSAEAPLVLEKIYEAATTLEPGTDLWRLMRDLTSAKRYLLRETSETTANVMQEYSEVIQQMNRYFEEGPASFAAASGLQDFLESHQACGILETGSAAWQCLRSRFLAN